ncbi:hypothetical protein BD779DRAFT_1569889 [Infundibulicybe gibba]|nr:hypothetical protein BD779DRAFT_1569889 [Infundibulicybe gibba]
MFSLNIMNRCQRIPLPRTLGPGVYRALSSRAQANQNSTSHTSDSYSKETDTTPPSDPKIHRLDPESENAQKPHEPPSGEWSRAGTQTQEYASVSKKKPYGAPGEDSGGERYGARPEWAEEKGPETSNPGEGPEGTEKEGRKPERR